VSLKVSEIWALIFLELELGPEIWLVVSMFVIWLNTLVNCLLVKLLLYYGFDHKQVEELSLLELD